MCNTLPPECWHTNHAHIVVPAEARIHDLSYQMQRSRGWPVFVRHEGEAMPGRPSGWYKG